MSSHKTSSQDLIPAVKRAAASRTGRIVLSVVGAAGLAALAVAIVGPRRIERRVIRPLRGAIEPEARRLWDESQRLRGELASLIQRTEPSGREKLIRHLQSWLGHFHAN